MYEIRYCTCPGLVHVSTRPRVCVSGWSMCPSDPVSVSQAGPRVHQTPCLCPGLVHQTPCLCPGLAHVYQADPCVHQIPCLSQAGPCVHQIMCLSQAGPCVHQTPCLCDPGWCMCAAGGSGGTVQQLGPGEGMMVHQVAGQLQAGESKPSRPQCMYYGSIVWSTIEATLSWDS